DFDLYLVISQSHFSGDGDNHSRINVRIGSLPRTLKSCTGDKASFIANSENSGSTGLFYLNNLSFNSDKLSLHIGVDLSRVLKWKLLFKLDGLVFFEGFRNQVQLSSGFNAFYQHDHSIPYFRRNSNITGMHKPSYMRVKIYKDSERSFTAYYPMIKFPCLHVF